VARHRKGGRHRRQRRHGAGLPAAGTAALVVAVTGALTLPAAADDKGSPHTLAVNPLAGSVSAPVAAGPALDVPAGLERFDVSEARAAQDARAARLAAEAVAAERARAERRAARARALARVYKAPTTNYRITAGFGTGGGLWSSGRHTGLDFAAPSGTRVSSVAAGRVLEAGWAGAYGQQIVIEHAGGVRTSYSHLSRVTVSAGDTVNAGQRIGAIGMTGNSTGPHLHLEVLQDEDTPIDPRAWLRKHGVKV
jgi:murein DD-endopeptidase MepM/ murein hydrolase activator NlpD